MFFFFSSRRRHPRCSLVTGVQTGALPICLLPQALRLHPAGQELAAEAAPTKRRGACIPRPRGIWQPVDSRQQESTMQRPRHFSMLREFQLAHWFTLANAFCGTGSLSAATRFLLADRTCVVSGSTGSARVVLGGWRLIQ